MKLRFYHIWVYRLFYWVWMPVLKANPSIVVMMRDHNQAWIDQHEYEQAQRELASEPGPCQ